LGEVNSSLSEKELMDVGEEVEIVLFTSKKG
jgi:hypothetical protein